MKKTSLLFLGLMTNFAFAQCDISGNSHIATGDTSQYSVGNELAQCKQCHQWSVTGNATIVGDNRQNKVVVRGQSAGNATLSLQYFSPQGLVKCSREIAVVNTGSSQQRVERQNDKNCDISLTNYKEVKMGENAVLLYPDTQQDLIYTWEANYQNGEQFTSSEKVPQFRLYEDNPITTINVKVFSKSCYKSFTKTYEPNFWKFLK